MIVPATRACSSARRPSPISVTGVPDRQLALELDGEGVHRDGADHAPRLAVDEHLGPGQVAPEAVRVADRHDPDPRRPLGDEAPAVAGALARLEELHLRELAAPARAPARARPRPDRCRTARGRRARSRSAPRRSATSGSRSAAALFATCRVRSRVRLGRLAEALDLLVGERRVGVGRRQVRHQADDLGGGCGQLREAVAAHPGVELDVHAGRPPGSRRRPRRRARAAPRAPRATSGRVGPRTMIRAPASSLRRRRPSATVATQRRRRAGASAAPATSTAPCP